MQDKEEEGLNNYINRLVSICMRNKYFNYIYRVAKEARVSEPILGVYANIIINHNKELIGKQKIILRCIEEYANNIDVNLHDENPTILLGAIDYLCKCYEWDEDLAEVRDELFAELIENVYKFYY